MCSCEMAAVGSTAAVPQFHAGPSQPVSPPPELLLCVAADSLVLLRVFPKCAVCVVVLSYAVRAFFFMVFHTVVHRVFFTWPASKMSGDDTISP